MSDGKKIKNSSKTGH